MRIRKKGPFSCPVSFIVVLFGVRGIPSKASRGKRGRRRKKENKNKEKKETKIELPLSRKIVS